VGKRRLRREKLFEDRRLEREKLFDDAMKIMDRDLPFDIVLLPMKGDPDAGYAFWRLARRSKGSYVIPSRDWP